jgi:hypothetical protein
MNHPQTSLNDILSLTGIFRLEKGRWPLHAAELQGFALGLNRSLDFMSFHRFRFQAEKEEEVVLEFWIRTAHTEWARRCRAKIFFAAEKSPSEDTVSLSVRIQNLPSQRVEEKSFCLMNEPSFGAA